MYNLYVKQFGEPASKWKLVRTSSCRESVSWLMNQYVYDGYEAKLEVVR